MKNDMPEVKPGEDYALRPQTPEEKAKWEAADIPDFKIKLDLSEEQIELLKEQVFMEFEAHKQERKDLNLEAEWKDRDSQYDGELEPIQNLDFQIDVRESKIKVDAIVRATADAFLPEGGDIVDVSPRPDESRKDGWHVAEVQQQFIDFAMDEEIKPELAVRKIASCAAKKFVGVGKLCWDINIQSRRREEHWEGKITDLGTSQDGKPISDNEGLRAFLNAYPDAPKRYPKQVKQLLAGQSVDVVVSYKEQVSNNPILQYVPIEDFYVRNACEYNKGLPNEHLIAERKRYSYWELKKLETDDEWDNVDKLFISGDEKDSTSKVKDYMTKEYKVMEFTTFFKLDPDDDEETKIKCWFDEDKQTFLAAYQYFYYSIDCDYIGFWMTVNDYGFYGNAKSVMYDLRDTHLAQDALISLLLQSIYVRNILTPITREGSQIESMFLDHDWEHGKPLPVDDGTIDISKDLGFVQWPSMDMQGGLVMLEKMKRIGSDVSRVSDMTTGGESQIDPRAPAEKTIQLLQQSGIGIRDYIKVFLPSFNIFATNLLQLYYQMNTEDRKYRIRSKSKQVTGQDIFGSIKREEMVVRTVIQSTAAAFVFDKVNEKREGMAALQTVRTDPYLSRQPKAQYKAIQIFLSSMGGKWKTYADVDIPSLEELEKEQMQVAIKAMAMLLQAAKQQGEVTGVSPEMGDIMKKAPGAIAEAQMVDYNPALAPKEGQ